METYFNVLCQRCDDTGVGSHCPQNNNSSCKAVGIGEMPSVSTVSIVTVKKLYTLSVGVFSLSRAICIREVGLWSWLGDKA